MAGYNKNSFKYNEYFTGTGEFCFQKFSYDLLNWVKCDPKETAMQKQAGKVLGKIFPGLIGVSNYSSQVRGVRNVKNYEKYLEQLEEDYLADRPYSCVNILLNELDKDKISEWIELERKTRHTDSSDVRKYRYIIDYVHKNLKVLENNKDAVLLQQPQKCKGFSADVLTQLVKYCEKVKTTAENTGTENIIVNCLCELLCNVFIYFLTNGRGFMFLAEAESAQQDNKTVELFRALLPEQEKGIKEELFCRTDAGPLADITANNKYVLLTGDGGFGKSTALIQLAYNLVKQGRPAVYICANDAELMADWQISTFLYNRIAAFSEEWKLSSNLTDTDAAFENILDRQLGSLELTVIVDALNELSPLKRKIILNTIKQLQKILRIRIVAASRYKEPSLEDSFAVKELVPLDPMDILEGEKRKCYAAMQRKNRQILTSPMMLNLYLEADTPVCKASELLAFRHMRDIAKAEGDKTVLLDILAEFTGWLYNRSYSQVFTRQHIAEFAAQHNFPYTFAEIMRQFDALLPAKADGVYTYSHENIRDYLVAYSISRMFVQTEDCAQAAVSLFGEGTASYSGFICGMVQEMLEDKREKIIESLRKNSCTQDWNSDAVANATRAVVKIFNTSADELYGLNLTKTHLEYVVDGDFTDACLSSYTLQQNSIGTALFAISADEDSIYAFGKNRMHKFDKNLTETGSAVFPSGTSTVSYSSNADSVLLISRDNKAYLVDKKEFSAQCITGTILEGRKAFSVVKNGSNGYLLGLENSIAVLKNGAVEEFVPLEDRAVYPVDKPGRKLYYFAGRELKEKNRTDIKTLWSLNDIVHKEQGCFDGMTIKQVCAVSPKNYICLFYKKGSSALVELTLTKDCVQSELVQLISYEEETAHEKVNMQKSISLDYSKVNDICFADGVLFAALNSGGIEVFRKSAGGWVRAGEIDYGLENPGECIEACCALPQGRLLFSATMRSLVMAEYCLDKNRLFWSTVRKEQGINDGIRRILLSPDRLTIWLSMYNGLCRLTRGNVSEQFAFDYKYKTENWCWDAVMDKNGDLYFTDGNRLMLLQAGSVQPVQVKAFDTKIEALYLSDSSGKSFIAIAVGYRVKLLDIASGEITEPDINEKLENRRPLCFFRTYKDNAVRVGYTTAQKKQYDDIRVLSAVTGRLDLNSNRIEAVGQSFTDCTDGWYRNVSVTSDNICIAAGIREIKDGSWRDVSAVFEFPYFSSRCRLAGHNGYTTDGRIIEKEQNGTLVGATCGYDGFLNIYKIAPGQKGELMPHKQIKVADTYLYSFVTDGIDSILAAALDGNLYRVNLCTGTVSTEFSNNNIWIMHSDLGKIDAESCLCTEDKNRLRSLKNEI